MHWSHSLEIDTPAETVWAVTMDVDALPTISPTTMTRVERLDPGSLRPGSRVRIKQPMQPARVWTVVATEAPRRFEWETTVGRARMVATHLVEPTTSGCRNTLRLELTGRGAGLLGRLLGRTFARVLATENAGFKRVAEAQARTSAGTPTEA
jgi:uncharacterized membrane protein